jgi:tRNA (guanine26-N2/guanine27-N2)-dimethyltransferase
MASRRASVDPLSFLCLCRPYCHEMALRILLASLEQHAARYKRHIKPVLCLSIDFYIRIFVRVYTSGET